MRSPRKLLMSLLRSQNGAASLELVLALPLLFFGLLLTAVTFDGFRSRHQMLVATHTVVDLLSRESTMFTAQRLERMNDIFEYLSQARFGTRLRISSMIWSYTEERHRLQWSYGTRGLLPLTDDMLELMATGDDADWNTVVQHFSEQSAIGPFAGVWAQPERDLLQRVPAALPGEAVIVVEGFGRWVPFAPLGVQALRFSPIASARPRFTPFVHLEGAIPVYPEDYTEVIAPVVGVPPDPNVPPDTTPSSTTPVTVVNQNFSGGNTTGWSRTQTVTSGSTTLLGLFGNETFATPVTRSISLPLHTGRVDISFDLWLVDSWDGRRAGNEVKDAFTIFINDRAISTDIFRMAGDAFHNRERYSYVVHGATTWVVSMRRIRGGSNFIGSYHNDHVWRVDIVGLNPSAFPFILGLSSRLDQALSDESWAFTNFRVTATSGTATVPTSPAPTGSVIGTHPSTRFPIYSGCPDPFLRGAVLRVNRSYLALAGQTLDLPARFSFRRFARGSTPVSQCPDIPGEARFDASALHVLDWDNEGLTGTGNRLRILTEDSNNGATCNAALLVRDPDGQWWYNDRSSSTNLNARLDMGSARSGHYHIFLGTVAGNTCSTFLVMERY